MRKILSYLLVCSILASCSTSNQVVSNKLFQKRKYQKGWHVNSTKSYKKEKKVEELIVYSLEKEVANDTTTTNKEEEQAPILQKKGKVKQAFQIKNFKQLAFQPLKEKVLLTNTGTISFSEKTEFNTGESISRVDEVTVPPIDRENRSTRFLLALFAIGFLYFFHIGPLAILIAVGKVESLKINMIIWLVGVMILAIALGTFLLMATFLTSTLVALLIIGFSFILAADIHALYVIFRGY
jgi:hypothetical protein